MKGGGRHERDRGVRHGPHDDVRERQSRLRPPRRDWLVEQRPDAPGTYHFAWLTGPDAGYGSTLGTSNGSAITKADIRRSIAGFLADIDPGTGYLD